MNERNTVINIDDLNQLRNSREVKFSPLVPKNTKYYTPSISSRSVNKEVAILCDIRIH